MRVLNLQSETDSIVDFIKRKFIEANLENAIIGLSGGIDSAVSAALSVKALGKDHVFAIMMPYKNSNPASLTDALAVAESLHIEHKVMDITPMVDAYFTIYEPDADNLRRGNRMARERMCILFDYSAKMKGMVIGTGNRSEIMTGYFTQHGDGACAFEPIGNLYKTEVREIARMLELPDIVISKHPTADLWDGQTDESEMGITYRILDEILYLKTEKSLNNQLIINMGYTEKDVETVSKLIRRSEFKRHLPEIPGIVDKSYEIF